MKKQMLCLLFLSLFIAPSYAQLRQNFYQNTCPNVESIVTAAVTKKFQQTFVTIPGTLRLFFHDCFVRVCLISLYQILPFYFTRQITNLVSYVHVGMWCFSYTSKSKFWEGPPGWSVPCWRRVWHRDQSKSCRW